VRVKTQEKPVWAWDRARDGGLTGGTVFNNIKDGSLALRSQAGDTGLRLTGRGEYSQISLKTRGNYIFYNESGFNLNSSNRQGENPEPIDKYPSGTSGPGNVGQGAPGNSTRMTFGVDAGVSTNTACQRDPNNPDRCANSCGCKGWIWSPRTCETSWCICSAQERKGDFNFLKLGGKLRISVDYEIVWTAGAGRNMWIMVNNNEANAMQSVLSTNSQLLIQPLTDPRGTRATAVTTLNVDDFITRKIPGFETLETAFIGIVCLSNGGSINISGIRIEKEE